MADIILNLTDAGLAAIQAAGGSDVTLISEVGLTATAFVFAPTMTVLPGEFKRIDTVAGIPAAANIAHITAYDNSGDAYEATGVALYLDDGTLFGAASSGDALLIKGASAFALVGFDIVFGADLAASIDFGTPEFANPPATTATPGVVELATVAEARAGIDAERAVTPAGAAALVVRLMGINPGLVQHNSSTVLSAADVGKVIVLGGTGGTLTLPSGADMPENGMFHIFTQGGNWSVSRGGGDVISIGPWEGGTAITSFGMSGADHCTMMWRIGSWLVISGTPMLAVPGGVFGTKAPLPNLGAGAIGQWQSIGIATNLLYLPAGGTWAYWCSNNGFGFTGIAAGTTAIFSGVLNNAFGFCWRIA